MADDDPETPEAAADEPASGAEPSPPTAPDEPAASSADPVAEQTPADAAGVEEEAPAGEAAPADEESPAGDATPADETAVPDESAGPEDDALVDDDPDGAQRRENVRVMVQYPLTVLVAGHPSTRIRTRDISATGVGFATRLPLENESRGQVTIHFPDWNFTKEFVVRFVKPILAGRQVGVQFDSLGEDDREKLVKEVFAVQRAQLQEQRAREKAGGG